MSRTSTALKRLGVAGLATVTIGAGIPAFFATGAQAATGDTLTLTPETASASQGTCELFTVTVKTATGAAATNREIDVQVTERTAAGAASSETFDVDFCTTTTDPNVTFTTSFDSSDEDGADNTGNETDTAEFLTGADGTVTFGLIGQRAGTTGIADVLAFLDADGDDTLDTGEQSDTSVFTVTNGGTTTPAANETNPGSDSANNSVTSLDATPETATNFIGETHEISVLLKNAQGDTVAGAAPIADITSGPNNAAAISCTLSDNDGVSICSYAGGTAGTDTIVVYINKFVDANNDTVNDNNAALNSGEPSDEVQKTWADAPTGLAVVLTCEGPSTTDENDACVNPLASKSETFTATVTKADGTDAGTDRDPAVGVIVNFTENGADSTVAPTSCTTSAAGTCSTLLSETTPTQGETVAVTATIRGQDPANDATVTSTAGADTDDTATKTWEDSTNPADARNIVLTPPSATTPNSEGRTFTATVTDRFGRPLAGVEVTFTESGAGRFTNGGSTIAVLTNGSGVASAEVVANANETGTQTVVATITGYQSCFFTCTIIARGSAANDDQCEQAAGFGPDGPDAGTDPDPQTGTSPAGNCADTSTNQWTSTASPSATPTATTSAPPGCSVAAQNLPFSINDADKTVKATAPVTVTIRGAAAGQTVELQAYQQNHYGTANFSNAANTRTAVADANGAATITLRFSSSARMRAKVAGCAFGANAGFNNPGGNVLFVSAAIFMNVNRVGVRTYVISGDSIPARPGGMIINIYCQDSRCKSPNNPSGIIRQPRANAVNGEYTTTAYTFPASFQGTRVNIQALVRGDAQNVSGGSNVRSLLIG